MATEKTTKQGKQSQGRKSQKAQLSTMMFHGEQPTPLMLLSSKEDYVIGH